MTAIGSCSRLPSVKGGGLSSIVTGSSPELEQSTLVSSLIKIYAKRTVIGLVLTCI